MLRLRWRELTTAAVFALLAVAFLVEGRELPLEARGVPGPGLFPFLVAVAMLVFSAALAAATLVPQRRAASEPVEWRRPAFGWAALLGCSLLMPLVGFVAAMVLLVGLLLLGMERRRDRVSIVSVVAVPVTFYVIFAVLLDVRLPAGPFG